MSETLSIIFPQPEAEEPTTTTCLTLDDSFVEVASVDETTLKITRTYNQVQRLRDGEIVWHTPTPNEWTIPCDDFQTLARALAEIDRGERVNAKNGRSGYNALVGKVALAHFAFETDGSEPDDKELKKHYKAVATFITAIKKDLFAEALSDDYECEDAKRGAKKAIKLSMRNKAEHLKTVKTELEKAEAKVAKLTAELKELN